MFLITLKIAIFEKNEIKNVIKIKTISIKGEKILILLAPTIFPNALPKVKFKIINVVILKINDIIEWTKLSMKNNLLISELR